MSHENCKVKFFMLIFNTKGRHADGAGRPVNGAAIFRLRWAHSASPAILPTFLCPPWSFYIARYTVNGDNLVVFVVFLTTGVHGESTEDTEIHSMSLCTP